MTCLVTGQLVRPNGSSLTETEVSVRAPRITATDAGAVMPAVVNARTDEDGRLELALLPGIYRLMWSDGARGYESPLSVPDEATADLADLLVAAPVPVRGPEGPEGPPGPALTVVRVPAGDPWPPAVEDPAAIYLREA